MSNEIDIKIIQASLNAVCNALSNPENDNNTHYDLVVANMIESCRNTIKRLPGQYNQFRQIAAEWQKTQELFSADEARKGIEFYMDRIENHEKPTPREAVYYTLYDINSELKNIQDTNKFRGAISETKDLGKILEIMGKREGKSITLKSFTLDYFYKRTKSHDYVGLFSSNFSPNQTLMINMLPKVVDFPEENFEQKLEENKLTDIVKNAILNERIAIIDSFDYLLETHIKNIGKIYKTNKKTLKKNKKEIPELLEYFPNILKNFEIFNNKEFRNRMLISIMKEKGAVCK